MNLILLEPTELSGDGVASLRGRRARHIQGVLKVGQSDTLRAGVVNGKLGKLEILGVEADAVHVHFDVGSAVTDPPKPLPLTLVLALPRPKVIKRVLASVTSLGVKRIILLNAYRVEKPYWSSQQLTPEFIRASLKLGLEQARDTVLPEVVTERLFKPFVEDRLGALAQGSLKIVAHPGGTHPVPAQVREAVTLVVGPEGGFIPYEIEALEAQGFAACHIGERILKVETAVSYLLGRLLPGL